MNAIRDGNEYGNEFVQGKDREGDEKGAGHSGCLCPPPLLLYLSMRSLLDSVRGRSQGSGEETPSPSANLAGIISVDFLGFERSNFLGDLLAKLKKRIRSRLETESFVTSR